MQTTLSNIPEASPRMVAHALVSWAVALAVMAQLWRYSRHALRLRTFHLLTAPRGAESHAVLCTDVPGLAAGTIPARLGGSALAKLVPSGVMRRARAQAAALEASSGAAQVDAGTGGWRAPDRWAQAAAGVAAAGGGQGAVEDMVEAEFQAIYGEDFDSVSPSGALLAVLRACEGRPRGASLTLSAPSHTRTQPQQQQQQPQQQQQQPQQQPPETRRKR